MNQVAFLKAFRYVFLMNFLQFLSRWPIILASFVIMNATGFSFGFVQQAIGGDLLDMIWNGDTARTRLLEMTAEQKSNHIWATAILDTIYPIAFGSFLIGLTARLSHQNNVWLTWPAFGAIIIDFVENSVQIAALNGHQDILFLKSIVTPLKFAFVLLASVIVLMLIIAAAYRKVFRRK